MKAYTAMRWTWLQVLYWWSNKGEPSLYIHSYTYLYSYIHTHTYDMIWCPSPYMAGKRKKREKKEKKKKRKRKEKEKKKKEIQALKHVNWELQLNTSWSITSIGVDIMLSTMRGAIGELTGGSRKREEDTYHATRWSYDKKLKKKTSSKNTMPSLPHHGRRSDLE